MALGKTAQSPDRTARLALHARGSNRAGASEIRSRILATAAQLYRRIGQRKTTVADIAEDMSMSPANVYRFFASKHAIESAVAGLLLDELVRVAEEAARQDGSAVDRLRAVLNELERLNEARRVHDPRLQELLVIAIRENWSVVSSCSDRLTFTVAALISEGQASGDFSAGNPLIVARCVLGATGGLDLLLLAAGASSMRPTLDEMIAFCIGALRAVPSDDPYSTQKAERYRRTPL